MKMQQHTGEHIVSGLVHKRFGYQNVGFHLGSEDCTMDFNGEITKEEIREIEWEANRAVVRNLEVEVAYPDQKVLQTLVYRSKIEIEGQVRIVTIPEYDVCACCAPHVKQTGEIGQIRLTGVQRYKGGVRVTMLCGFRALEDYRRKAESTGCISSALCVKEEDVAQGVEKLKNDCTEWKQRYAQLKRDMLAIRAERMAGQPKDVIVFADDLEGEELRILMNLVLDHGKRLCAVFGGDEEHGFRYVIGSRILDMRPLAKELNETFHGRGGGKPEMVQGSVQGNESEMRAWIHEKAREMNG